MMENVFGIPAHTDQEAFTNLLEALKIAQSACKQLTLYTDKPQWIMVESQLGLMQQAVTSLMLSGMIRARQ